MTRQAFLSTNPLLHLVEQIRTLHDTSQHSRIVCVDVPGLLDGGSSVLDGTDRGSWGRRYQALRLGQGEQGPLPPWQEIARRAGIHQKSGAVPLVLVELDFDLVDPAAVSVSRDSDRITLNLRGGSNAGAAFVPHEGLFATALPRDDTDYFTPMAEATVAASTRFVLDPALYLGADEALRPTVEVDLADGEGPRRIDWGQVCEVRYRTLGLKELTVATTATDGTVRHAKFTLDVRFADAPTPDLNWTGLSYDTNGPDGIATGHAWVYYGSDNGVKHTGIVNPIVISEGFPGNYTLDYLWWSLTTNAQGLADTLLADGYDVVILGYDNGTTYIESNAGVVVACINEIIANRQAANQLVVGGACMGGVVVRYALAWMEKNYLTHDTRLFFSIDSPHQGINMPASLQYLLGLASEWDSSIAAFYAKILDPAAQELLLYATGDHGTTPAAPGSMRSAFLASLSDVDQFPSLPTKIGIADGMGDGTGNGTPAGQDMFQGSEFYVYTAPGGTENVMLSVVDAWSYYWTGCPFAIDGAPGSVEQYFSQAAGQLGTTANYSAACFVPTISALAMDNLDIYTDGGLYENLSYGTPAISALDAYLYNTTNAQHMQVTTTMATWLVNQLNGEASKSRPSIP